MSLLKLLWCIFPLVPERPEDRNVSEAVREFNFRKNMEITFKVSKEVVEVILLILGLLGALSVCFLVSDVFNFLRRKINKKIRLCGTK